eukprot:TRINITY_DN2499_c0_g1_i5.p1 TRINITY_DN2499_c0_g1~~TRINITY_DN2499_c0_g1_i5.p1  ORF type:complete len:232 (-),score=32.64 TRINITY_DN2499_c0_g1_i5:39-734(-)
MTEHNFGLGDFSTADKNPFPPYFSNECDSSLFQEDYIKEPDLNLFLDGEFEGSFESFWAPNFTDQSFPQIVSINDDNMANLYLKDKEQSTISHIPSFTNMADVQQLLSDVSRNDLQSSETHRREVFRVQRETSCAPPRRIGGLTALERLAKIAKYKSKARVWKAKRRVKNKKTQLLKMTGQLPIVARPIFKYVFDAKCLCINILPVLTLSLIHICRCRRYAVCRSRWSPYH